VPCKAFFHITENGVEPLEYFAVVMFAFIVRDDRLMIAVSLGDSGKTIQAIGDNEISISDLLCAPSKDFQLLDIWCGFDVYRNQIHTKCRGA
jgi:hypothetical protein